MTTLGFQIKDLADDLPLPDWYLSAVTAFFFISLGVNAVATALIVYRIMTVYNDIRGFDTRLQVRAYGKNLNPLVSIVIESGLITFAGQLAQSIMYKSASAAFPLVGGSVVMLYVRASCRLLIWYSNFIYLLHRELRRLLFLCVSRGAFPTIIIHQRQRIQNTQYSRPLRADESGIID